MEKIKKYSERGGKLRILRKKLGLTQKQFGERFGYAGHQIGNYEREGNIPAELLEKLQRAGHDVRDIISGPAASHPDVREEDEEIARQFRHLMAHGGREIREILVREFSLIKELIQLRREKK